MSSKSILVVDDNSINLELMEVLLSAEDYDVYTAKDAAEALSVLARFRPDLILMDIQLPGMDGLALTRQLKSDPYFQDIPIIAITSYAMKGDRERVFAAGCDGYIAKPINVHTLPTWIARYIKDKK